MAPRGKKKKERTRKECVLLRNLKEGASLRDGEGRRRKGKKKKGQEKLPRHACLRGERRDG